jgi:hypothetical protein
MADVLLAARGQTSPPLPVGKCWVSRWIKNQPELQTKWNRIIHSQRKKCEETSRSEPKIHLNRQRKLVQQAHRQRTRREVGPLVMQGRQLRSQDADPRFCITHIFGHTELSPCIIEAKATLAGTVTVTVTASPVDAVPSTISIISDLTTHAISAAQLMITKSVQNAFYEEGDYE